VTAIKAIDSLDWGLFLASADFWRVWGAFYLFAYWFWTKNIAYWCRGMKAGWSWLLGEEAPHPLIWLADFIGCLIISAWWLNVANWPFDHSLSCRAAADVFGSLWLVGFAAKYAAKDNRHVPHWPLDLAITIWIPIRVLLEYI
jgi:hypothetical protein